MEPLTHQDGVAVAVVAEGLMPTPTATDKNRLQVHLKTRETADKKRERRLVNSISVVVPM